ncbi:Dpy 30 motif [Trypanosoma vivax]|nr:Dpy 30 motif [Trypanosoma vivax]
MSTSPLQKSTSGRELARFSDYLQENNVPALFDRLTAVLLEDKPENPVDFILTWLRNERLRCEETEDMGASKLPASHEL